VPQFIAQGRVVEKVDNAIHRINHYAVNSVVCFHKSTRKGRRLGDVTSVVRSSSSSWRNALWLKVALLYIFLKSCLCCCSLATLAAQQLQKTSKGVYTRSSPRVTHSEIASCATLLFLSHFDVICDLLLNRRTAT